MSSSAPITITGTVIRLNDCEGAPWRVKHRGASTVEVRSLILLSSAFVPDLFFTNTFTSVDTTIREFSGKPLRAAFVAEMIRLPLTRIRRMRSRLRF
jgi:hypothetical protein